MKIHCFALLSILFGHAAAVGLIPKEDGAGGSIGPTILVVQDAEVSQKSCVKLFDLAWKEYGVPHNAFKTIYSLAKNKDTICFMFGTKNTVVMDVHNWKAKVPTFKLATNLPRCIQNEGIGAMTDPLLCDYDDCTGYPEVDEYVRATGSMTERTAKCYKKYHPDKL